MRMVGATLAVALVRPSRNICAIHRLALYYVRTEHYFYRAENTYVLRSEFRVALESVHAPCPLDSMPVVYFGHPACAQKCQWRDVAFYTPGCLIYHFHPCNGAAVAHAHRHDCPHAVIFGSHVPGRHANHRLRAPAHLCLSRLAHSALI